MGVLFAVAYAALGLWPAAAILLTAVMLLSAMQSAMDNTKGLSRWSIETDFEWLTGSAVSLAFVWCWALLAKDVHLGAVLVFCLIYFPVNYLSNYVVRAKVHEGR